jgi:hypothetical protein
VIKPGSKFNRKRRFMKKNYTGEFKSKVAVDMIREQHTVAELSSSMKFTDPYSPDGKKKHW